MQDSWSNWTLDRKSKFFKTNSYQEAWLPKSSAFRLCVFMAQAKFRFKSAEDIQKWIHQKRCRFLRMWITVKSIKKWNAEGKMLTKTFINNYSTLLFIVSLFTGIMLKILFKHSSFRIRVHFWSPCIYLHVYLHLSSS